MNTTTDEKSFTFEADFETIKAILDHLVDRGDLGLPSFPFPTEIINGATFAKVIVDREKLDQFLRDVEVVNEGTAKVAHIWPRSRS